MPPLVAASKLLLEDTSYRKKFGEILSPMQEEHEKRQAANRWKYINNKNNNITKEEKDKFDAEEQKRKTEAFENSRVIIELFPATDLSSSYLYLVNNRLFSDITFMVEQR
jgi:hypothetical protein